MLQPCQIVRESILGSKKYHYGSMLRVVRYASSLRPVQPLRPPRQLWARCAGGMGLGAPTADVNKALGIKDQVGHVRMSWHNGSWGELEWLPGANQITLHTFASCLHYAGIAFEGLKAFEWASGKVYACNAAYNAERMNLSATRMGLPEVPHSLFLEACCMAVQGNRAMLPSYESGESLYVRPVLLATGPLLGPKIPCQEFTFLVIVQPLGAFVDPGGLDVRCAEWDRASPRGTGHAKVGGNYGSSVAELQTAVRNGYHDILYMNPLNRKLIDEFHGANFIAVSARNGAVVTPDSGTILLSSTRKMLVQLAQDEGIQVENREVELQELLEGGFSEAAGCGTSYVVTRLRSLTTSDGKVHSFGQLSVLDRLRERFVKIQRGEAEDKFGWMYPLQ